MNAGSHVILSLGWNDVFQFCDECITVISRLHWSFVHVVSRRFCSRFNLHSPRCFQWQLAVAF